MNVQTALNELNTELDGRAVVTADKTHSNFVTLAINGVPHGEFVFNTVHENFEIYIGTDEQQFGRDDFKVLATMVCGAFALGKLNAALDGDVDVIASGIDDDGTDIFVELAVNGLDDDWLVFNALDNQFEHVLNCWSLSDADIAHMANYMRQTYA